MSAGHGHRGSISQKSLSHYLADTEELTDNELIKLVADFKYQVRVLSLENEILERTILRLDPSLMNGIQQALEYATKLHSSGSLNVGSFIRSRTSGLGLLEGTSPSKIVASPSKVSTRVGGTIIYGTGPKINVLERAELVSNEMEILTNDVEKGRKKGAKKHAMLKAQLEEIGVKVAEVDKAVANFNQQVIIDGWDKIAQRIPAEIWIRYMTEWFKLSDSQIGKLRLRTSTLNTQFSKLRGQIKVKAELSESLRPVDFEKLKIENSEAGLLIEKKLFQLEELKKMTGDANLNLTIHKKALMEQNMYLSNVLKSIEDKGIQTIEINKEKDIIRGQADVVQAKLDKIVKVRQAFEVPDVMDYVLVKSEVTELKRSIKMLENRLHIQQIALTSLRLKISSMWTLSKLTQ